MITQQDIQQRCEQAWPVIRQAIARSRKQRLKDAIVKIWPRLPETFNGNMFALNVMGEASVHDVYYDTIFRYLRELKDEGRVMYTVGHKMKSRYHKVA